VNWNEEIRNIKLGTLFIFCGKCLLASILWMILFYAIIMIPMFIAFGAYGMWGVK